MLKDDELIGKFIKYSPEISEEVFDKIITRLQKAGFTQTNRSEDRCDWLGTTYKDFQKHQFLWITGIWYDRKNIFSLDNNSQHCTEISYKDIIGEEEWWKNLKKGDYVVSIKVKREYNINNIFQVKESNSEIIITELDNKNSTTNGWHRINFRLATPEEAKMYEHAGRPVDITTYKLPLAQESLKVEDLVEGEIYVSLYPTQGTYIFRNTNSQTNCSYINISSPDGSMNRFENSKGDMSVRNGFNNYRLANKEEREWLLTCLQENKFIPKEDVAKYLKPKFEVGKWYKNICNGEYIAKLTGIINGDKFPSIEYIYKNKYETTYSSVYFSMSSCKDAIECTLEEIQQYLPEGHVDKIKSFTVHDKCNIGDIIVSLEPKSIYIDTRKNGDLLKVLETSTNNSLYYKGYAYIVKENIDTYRLATPQEIEMYNKGIKNIYNVKEEPKKDNMEEILIEAKKRFPIGCKFYPVHDDGTLSTMEYVQKKECYIYEDDWIIGSANIRNPKGKWALLVSSPEESDLITQAKQRYPIGTKFIARNTSTECVITTGDFRDSDNDGTINEYENGRLKSTKGSYYCIYCNGRWANIVSSAQEKPFKAGDKLVGIYPYEKKTPELILKDEDEPVIFPNIKRERIVEIKIKLVD